MTFKPVVRGRIETIRASNPPRRANPGVSLRRERCAVVLHSTTIRPAAPAFTDRDLAFRNNYRFLPTVLVIAFLEFAFSVVAAIVLTPSLIWIHPSPGAGRASQPPTREPHEIANGLGVCG